MFQFYHEHETALELHCEFWKYSNNDLWKRYGNRSKPSEFTRFKGTRISLSDCDIINPGSTNGLFFFLQMFSFDREYTQGSIE